MGIHNIGYLIDDDIDIKENIVPEYQDNNGEHLAHAISPPENRHITGYSPEGLQMEAQDVLDLARAQGLEVVAVCGKRFVPKHNPDEADACEPCIKIVGDILNSLDQ